MIRVIGRGQRGGCWIMRLNACACQQPASVRASCRSRAFFPANQMHLEIYEFCNHRPKIGRPPTREGREENCK
uniref:Uncharacterized protein n=1 Tax=Oryza nivara TaxID=4536 RepID=A0A0E0GXN0_ORYNI